MAQQADGSIWLASMEQNAFTLLAKRPIATIGASDILKVLEPIWTEKNDTATRVKQRLSTIFDWAKGAGHYPMENPVNGLKSALVKIKSQPVHMAALSWQGLPHIFGKLDEREGTSARALEFIILPASRSGEVRGARWDDIDLEACIWTVPADRMKATKPHRISAPNARADQPNDNEFERPQSNPARRGGCGGMATIYDVARIAGVSTKTVSRVLNGEAPVSKATRKAIEAAIAQLGFVPSSAARMMRSQHSGLIGLITGAISMSPEPTQPAGLPELFIVQGIQRALASSGMTLMIADTAGDPNKAAPLIDTFLRHRVEGLIYVAEYHQHVNLPCPPAGTPMVLTNCFDDLDTPSILPDDQRGQRELVTQIIAAGHRRIAYLTLRPDVEAGRLRTAGYRDALNLAEIPFDPALVSPCDLPDREAETQLLLENIDRLLLLPDPPTVLCCGTDKMALEVYGILRSRGMKLPDEISVAGYDDYRVISEQLYPPLTTVDLPYRAMGTRAAQRLLALISGETQNDPAVERVAGPVCWRVSVKDLASQTRTE